MAVGPSRRRYGEAVALTLVWMAGGWLFDLNPNEYLLLGVPLIAGFQRYVRRRSFLTLWSRETTSFRFGKLGMMLAILLLITPAWALARTISGRNWIILGWLLCSACGAFLAAFALQHLRRAEMGRALAPTAVAILLGGIFITVAASARGRPLLPEIGDVPKSFQQFLLYFTVSFVLEEVAFRGCLDGHVYQAGGGQRYWWSAWFVSALWGIWHLPAVPIAGLPDIIVLGTLVTLQHSLIGVPLSLAWRASGSLALPAAAHALIDAYRNAVLG